MGGNFLVTNGVIRDGRTVDVEIRDGWIEAINGAGESDPGGFDQDETFDAGGRLVTPPLIEPHTHLVTAFTFSELRGTDALPSADEYGSGWDMYTAMDERGLLDDEAIRERARRMLRWFLANGITRVRTHADTSARWDGRLIEAMLDLRDSVADTVEIQVVGLPLDTLVDDEANRDSLSAAVEAGIDAVGGIPHKEASREAGVEHVERVVELADRHDRRLDLHIDETDDPGSRFTEVLAREAGTREIGSRTTASHLTALHSYPDAYAAKLIRLLTDAGLSVVTNPMTNAELQGRFDGYPVRRGHTRVDQLLEAGVPVGIGQDTQVDKYHCYGTGDPLDEVLYLAHQAHMTHVDQVPTLWDMLLDSNAAVFGVGDGDRSANGRYELAEGGPGSMVVYDAPDPYDALRRRASRPLVLVDGEAVARTENGASRVWLDGEAQEVDFTVW